MIRLRRAIDRSLEHRWLRIVVVLALAVLLAFVLIHTTHDAIHDSLVDGCLAVVALVLGVLGLRPRPLLRVAAAPATRRRAPPPRSLLLAAAERPAVAAPLRL